MQYGCIKGQSTTLQLLHMLAKWTEYLEKGKQINTIYSDFEMAFDDVSHKRGHWKFILKVKNSLQLKIPQYGKKFPLSKCLYV